MRTFFIRLILTLFVLGSALPVAAAPAKGKAMGHMKKGKALGVKKQALALDVKPWARADLGFSVRLPKGWTQQGAAESAQIEKAAGIVYVTFANPTVDEVVTSTSAQSAPAFVSLIVTPPLPADKQTLVANVAEEKKAMAAQGQTVVGERPLRIGGLPATEIAYRIGDAKEGREVMVIRDGRGYGVRVESLSARRATYKKLFDKLLKSIKFAKKSSAAPSAPIAKSGPRTFHVPIKNFAFTVPSVTVKKGDIVHFMHEDSAPHTVTAVDELFKGSDTLNNGGAFGLDTSTLAPGTYEYFCNIHPSMKGKIIVQ